MFEGILLIIGVIIVLSPCIHATWHVDGGEEMHQQEKIIKHTEKKTVNESLCSAIAHISCLGAFICGGVATCPLNEWSDRFQACILGAIYLIGLIFAIWRGNIHRKRRIEHFQKRGKHEE